MLEKKFEIGCEVKNFNPKIFENHLKRFKIGIQKNMRKFNIINFKENSFFKNSEKKHKPINLLILTKAEKKFLEINHKRSKKPFIIKKKNLLDTLFRNEIKKENILKNKINGEKFQEDEKENLKVLDIEEKNENSNKKKEISSFNIKNPKKKRRLTNAQKFTLLLN